MLRIHIPNDDRLFPGPLDTHLGEGPDSEDEWVVERMPDLVKTPSLKFSGKLVM